MQTSNRKMKMNSNDNDDSGGDRDHNKPIANRAAAAAAPTINRRRNKPEDQTQTIRGCTAEIHSVFATLRWQTNRTFFNGKIFGHSLPWATLCLYLSLAVFTVFFSIFGASLFRTALRNFLFSSSRFLHTHTHTHASGIGRSFIILLVPVHILFTFTSTMHQYRRVSFRKM